MEQLIADGPEGMAQVLTTLLISPTTWSGGAALRGTVMMTNAATIGEVLEVPFPRPRARLVLADNPEYNHRRAAVLEFLYSRRKLAARAA